MNVSLKPDHSLLDPNFESYKLSLLKIPIYEASSQNGVYCKPLNEVTSKQHLKAYNNINCLCVNPFDTSYVYYMSTDGSVVSRIQPPVHEKDSQLLDCLLNSDDTSHQLFLDCLFVGVSKKSEEDPICNDSISTYVTYLEWISYSSPESNMSWSIVRHQKFVASSFPEFAAFEGDCSALHICSERKFHAIYDSCNPSVHESYLNKYSESKQMDTEDTCIGQDPEFLVTWTQTDADEDINSSLLNVTFTLNGITLPSSYDSNIVSVEIIPICEESSKHQILRANLHSYIPVTKTKKNSDRPITLIDQMLYEPVEPNSSWTYDRKNNRIEIRMTKQNSHYWPRLLLDAHENKILTEMHCSHHTGLHDQMCVQSDGKADLTPKPPFNVGQLEEVDFPMSEDETDLLIQRFDHETLKCTHQAYLSGHQWLFKIRCATRKPNATHAFCIRHDVDGIVWLPSCQNTLTGRDPCVWRHVSTLQAFGYVLASKRESRYVSSPVLSDGYPLKFVAVADLTRRIYIYCQPLSNDSKDTELRRRTTANSSSAKKQQIVHVASQHVVTLPTNDPIIGFVATDKPYPSVLVCTQSTLYLLSLDG
ncbi:unnamed protein product [Schistosoma margrebowiei]|uniref:NudC domain-containing protein 1 n=1 Tax=Schistosoma margrebowiei TaxID=48269 RepID=A0A183N4W1_9TREM|nr:unnamed protein product [Schistosoma margrebowiei]